MEDVCWWIGGSESVAGMGHKKKKKKKKRKSISIVCIEATYVDEVFVVALPQIVQHSSVVQVRKISHILDFLKLGWVHRLALVFLESLFLIFCFCFFVLFLCPKNFSFFFSFTHPLGHYSNDNWNEIIVIERKWLFTSPPAVLTMTKSPLVPVISPSW